jgi:hypothetical protein
MHSDVAVATMKKLNDAAIDEPRYREAELFIGK